MVKKTYIHPTTESQTAETVHMMALSILEGKASNDDALTKSCEWEIWSDEDDTAE